MSDPEELAFLLDNALSSVTIAAQHQPGNEMWQHAITEALGHTCLALAWYGSGATDQQATLLAQQVELLIEARQHSNPTMLSTVKRALQLVLRYASGFTRNANP